MINSVLFSLGRRDWRQKTSACTRRYWVICPLGVLSMLLSTYQTFPLKFWCLCSGPCEGPPAFAGLPFYSGQSTGPALGYWWRTGSRRSSRSDSPLLMGSRLRHPKYSTVWSHLSTPAWAWSPWKSCRSWRRSTAWAVGGRRRRWSRGWQDTASPSRTWLGPIPVGCSCAIFVAINHEVLSFFF